MHYPVLPTLRVGVLIVLAAWATSCKKEEPELPSCTGIHWEYEGSAGPSEWGQLCVDYTACSGARQSPVSISGVVPDATLKPLLRTVVESKTKITNNGHTLVFGLDPGSTLTLDGVAYDLIQFHTHTPAEHTPTGTPYPMELHFVHQQPNTDNLAVLGVWVKEGASNALLESFIPSLPKATSEVFTSATTFNPQALFPANGSYYTYGGSLTTPPCSETVRWFVMETPIEASAAQINSFKAIEHSNARPVQQLGTRTIRYFRQ